jgi:hypothetical protein
VTSRRSGGCATWTGAFFRGFGGGTENISFLLGWSCFYLKPRSCQFWGVSRFSCVKSMGFSLYSVDETIYGNLHQLKVTLKWEF